MLWALIRIVGRLRKPPMGSIIPDYEENVQMYC